MNGGSVAISAQATSARLRHNVAGGTAAGESRVCGTYRQLGALNVAFARKQGFDNCVHEGRRKQVKDSNMTAWVHPSKEGLSKSPGFAPAAVEVQPGLSWSPPLPAPPGLSWSPPLPAPPGLELPAPPGLDHPMLEHLLELLRLR